MRFDAKEAGAAFRLAGFRDVDASADPRAFIGYLDRVAADLAPMVGRGLDLLRLTPGGKVLDVGCGSCALLPALAARVGPGGRIAGIDPSRSLVAEARRRVAKSGVPAQIELGDAVALPYGDGVFDAARADRVLMFVPDAGKAVSELARVTRPGGRVVVTEGDQGAAIVDGEWEATCPILATACHEFANPWIGRALRRHFVAAGLRDIECEMLPAISTSFAEWSRRLGIVDTTDRAVASGRLSRAAADAWLDSLRERDRRGQFFAASVFFVVSATK
ncbi:MAG TPA: methyltransferase domain-containing protein [Burkholderiales bacterium]|nr:methyltransferase domain-containing protein [Burkholderiales bacterium]